MMPTIRPSMVFRGTGILAHAEQGYEANQTANDIGMSRQNVGHCMRFRDQMKGRGQRSKTSSPCQRRGLDHEPRDRYIGVQ